jgi:hypothetical protein
MPKFCAPLYLDEEEEQDRRDLADWIFRQRYPMPFEKHTQPLPAHLLKYLIRPESAKSIEEKREELDAWLIERRKIHPKRPIKAPLLLPYTNFSLRDWLQKHKKKRSEPWKDSNLQPSATQAAALPFTPHGQYAKMMPRERAIRRHIDKQRDKLDLYLKLRREK